MLNNFFEAIISIILPARDDVAEIENMNEADIARKIPEAGDIDEKYKALFQYKNKIARKAVWEIKYRGNKKIARTFSKLLYEIIIDAVADEISFSNFGKPLLIPVPGSKNSAKERGFNQCELIVKEMAGFDTEKIFEISFDALKKVRETENQSKIKNREKRLKNLIGCFLADPQKVKGRSIIIIDDVITTGATMKEISKILEEAGAKKVIGFALAH